LSDNVVSYSNVSYKLRDFATFLDSDLDIENSNTSTGFRAERYPQLLSTFTKNPVFGCYFLDYTGNGYNGAGAHLHWMNKLTVTGIFGFLTFLIIPIYFIKSTIRHFNSEYKFFYFIASIAILSYGMIKTLTGREAWYAFFIVLPGMYYLPILKSFYNHVNRIKRTKSDFKIDINLEDVFQQSNNLG
jgi:hypothetical protein